MSNKMKLAILLVSIAIILAIIGEVILSNQKVRREGQYTIEDHNCDSISIEEDKWLIFDNCKDGKRRLYYFPDGVPVEDLMNGKLKVKVLEVPLNDN